jgi:hypothetical protein
MCDDAAINSREREASNSCQTCTAVQKALEPTLVFEQDALQL